MHKEQALKYIWTKTHKDYKGIHDGQKTIMVYRNGSCLVSLDQLSDDEILSRCKDYQGV
jgi:hypothetical protein